MKTPRKYILIVDDDPSITKLLESTLSRYHFDITIVDSLQKAKEEIKRLPPHILFLDIQLKDGNGLELLKDATSKFNLKKTIIFVFSQAQDLSTIHKAQSYGATDYIKKPFNKNVILQKIKKYSDEQDFISHKFNETIKISLHIPVQIIKEDQKESIIITNIKLSKGEEVVLSHKSKVENFITSGKTANLESGQFKVLLEKKVS